MKRAAREERNPQTGKTMKIEACKAPKFKAGKALKRRYQLINSFERADKKALTGIIVRSALFSVLLKTEAGSDIIGRREKCGDKFLKYPALLKRRTVK